MSEGRGLGLGGVGLWQVENAPQVSHWGELPEENMGSWREDEHTLLELDRKALEPERHKAGCGVSWKGKQGPREDIPPGPGVS